MLFGPPIRYAEPVFRPPAEAESLILQLTIGCSHNLCTYCAMYRTKKFSVRPADEIAEEINKLAAYFKRRGEAPRKIFLGDGDALAAPTDFLIDALERIKGAFPKVRRISSYAMADNVLKKSPQDLAALKALGLSLAYVGMESGCDEVLKLVVKGNKAADFVEACNRLDQAGWQTSMIIMLGLGGKKFSAQHATDTARVVSEIAPHFLSFLTTVVIPETPYARAVKNGTIEELTIRETLTEMRQMLAGLNPQKRRVIFRANHVSNLLPLEGQLPRDREALVQTVTDWIARAPEGVYPEHDPAFL